MCKLFIIAGMKTPVASKLGWKLTETIAPMISKTDNHGIGYMALSRGKTMSIERWTDNDRFGQCVDDETNSAMKILGYSICNYSYVGQKVKKGESAIIALHTRFATCGHGIKNTHPFVFDGVGLIHNGIIENHSSFPKHVSDCDSEALLTRYLACGVKRRPEMIQKAMQPLTGYYAVGAMTADYIDVWKTSRAFLYVTYSRTLKAYIYCTSKESLVLACKKCGVEIVPPETVKSERLVRHGLDGLVIKKTAFQEPQVNVVETHYVPARYRKHDFDKWDTGLFADKEEAMAGEQ